MLQSTSSFNVHCAVSATANKSCLAWPQPFRLLKVLVAVTIFCYLLLVIICLAPIHSFSWSFVAKHISGSKPSQCHFSPPPCYGFGMNKLRSSQTWLWEFNFLSWSVVLLEYRRVTNTTRLWHNRPAGTVDHSCYAPKNLPRVRTVFVRGIYKLLWTFAQRQTDKIPTGEGNFMRVDPVKTPLSEAENFSIFLESRAFWCILMHCLQLNACTATRSKGYIILWIIANSTER